MNTEANYSKLKAFELSEITGEEAFRDSIGTLKADGKRRWIFPKKPSGRYTNARTVLSFLLLAFLFSAPFITVNGHPFLLFNILERKFILFGQPFWPQDFHLFVVGALVSIVAVALFTMVFGRIFCGWVCPQTIFMEMVFRKIEYWLIGDAAAQQKFHDRKWDTDKIWRSAARYLIFFAIAFLIGNTFLAYIIGKNELLKIVSEPPAQHIGGLAGMLAFSGAFFMVFAFFREQVCIIACPYGRLQGVLLDGNTIQVTYDYIRGEPRGKLKKNEERSGCGDCISCGLCVQVCPTGIDIRNGSQLECVNCTACIDACDAVMDKINKPRGLIRYASTNEVKDNAKFRFTPRMMMYSFVLVGLMVGLAVLLFTRSDVETTVLRSPGTLYQTQPDGAITNVYQYQIVNKTFDPKQVKWRLVSPVGQLTLSNNSDNLTIKSQETHEGVLIVALDRKNLKGLKTPLEIEIIENDKVVDKVKTNFMGPY